MTPDIIAWCERIKHSRHVFPKRVLEVGSRDVNGTARGVFAREGVEYVGVDLQAGIGVDVVGDACKIMDWWLLSPFGFSLFDLAICAETLEHCADPLGIVKRMRLLLNPGGFLILTSPGQTFPEHRFPHDFWRLMPDAFEILLLNGMEILEKEITPDPCLCYLARQG
jgi:O-antigen biosynthesis protein